MKTSDKPVVLIVDDNIANIEVLGAVLAKDYEICFATDGAQGLELAARVAPALILLDVMMPGMNGFETCQRLRADPQMRDTPVIFISALDAAADKVRAFQVGGNDYVTKPFRPEEVHARVCAHVALYCARHQLYEREEMLRSNLAQLEAANAALKEIDSQLQQSEKMAGIGQLAAGLAQEINTPIGFVNSSLGSLQCYFADLFKTLAAYEQAEAELPPETLASLVEMKRKADLSQLRQDCESLLTDSLGDMQRVKRIVQDLKDSAQVDETDKQRASLEEGVEQQAQRGPERTQVQG